MSSERPSGSSGSVTSQEHPVAPIAPSMAMPPSSPARGDAPPRLNPEPLPGAYHPGFGGPTSSYHQAPFPAAQGGYPAGGAYGQGYPPYSYSPPSIHGYPPGYAPPPYGSYGGFPGYPTQQARPVESKPLDKSRRKSPPRSRSARTSPQRVKSDMPSKVAGLHNDQRGSADMIPVKPMRNAFHFFMDDMEEKLRPIAEDEVIRSSGGVDPYLVNTNLNMRIVKAWEESTDEVRALYMEKEEEDRRRFMADDEVASRHCATLTARARSPKLGTSKPSSKTSKGDDEERSEDSGTDTKKEAVGDDDKKRTPPPENGESPTKKSRTDEEESENNVKRKH